MSGAARAVGLLGVPLDLGAGRRGTDMGPSAVRLARVAARLENLGLSVRDHGYVAVAAPETRDPRDPKFRFGAEIVRTCRRLAGRVRAILADGAKPLVLGGDHSIAMGTVAGIASSFDEPIGLLWIDAHADLNTVNTTPSGNVHGMPLATILGQGDTRLLGINAAVPMVDVVRTAIIGLRDVDEGEARRIRDLGVTVFTMKDIDQRGMSACMADALAVVTNETAGFHLSFDMDALDPEVAPGVGTPVPGGLTYREAHFACELIADTRRLLSMEVVEVNPILDDRNRTAQLAVELILSTLGKRIY